MKKKKKPNSVDISDDLAQSSLSELVLECIKNNYDLNTTVREVNRIGNYNEDDIKTYYDSYKTYLIWPIFHVYI